MTISIGQDTNVRGLINKNYYSISVEEVTSANITSATRQGIMRLLLSTIDQPAPNIAHFLLGFEIRKPVSSTNLQDPGELRSTSILIMSNPKFTK